MFKIIVFFIIMLFSQLDVGVDILPPMWKASALFHQEERLWAQNALLFIYMSAPSQERVMYLCYGY
jgi:hypothetical protein